MDIKRSQEFNLSKIPLWTSLKLGREFKDCPVRTMLRLAHDYSFNYCLDYGFKKIFILSDVAAIRHVLVDNHSNYFKGTAIYVQDIKPILKDGLLTSEGESWQRQRKHIQPAFHYKNLINFLDNSVHKCLQDVFSRWDKYAHSGESLDMHKEMHALTLSVISEALFSADCKGNESLIFQAIAAMQKMIQPFRFRHLFSLPPSIINLLNSSARKKMHLIDNVLRSIIAKRKQSDQNQYRDLLSQLMLLKDDGGNPLSEEQILDNIRTYFLAGHETTAVSMTWILAQLSKYPAERQKLYDELNTVLGNRHPTFSDLENLTYTKMFIQEALRLYPTAYSLSRTTIKPDEINGHFIPSGSEIIINTYLTHHNPLYWDNPHAFNPQRFSPENAQQRVHGSYLPFGAGPRVCIGQGFALGELALILVNIAQRYELDLAFNAEFTFNANLTLRPKYGMPMVIKKLK